MGRHVSKAMKEIHTACVTDLDTSLTDVKGNDFSHFDISSKVEKDAILFAFDDLKDEKTTYEWKTRRCWR
jgi:hypothetical protein